MTDDEIRTMVRKQIRDEFGQSVEFGSGCAGAAIEAMMIQRIKDNRRQLDELLTNHGIKTQ